MEFYNLDFSKSINEIIKGEGHPLRNSLLLTLLLLTLTALGSGFVLYIVERTLGWYWGIASWLFTFFVLAQSFQGSMRRFMVLFQFKDYVKNHDEFKFENIRDSVDLNDHLVVYNALLNTDKYDDYTISIPEFKGLTLQEFKQIIYKSKIKVNPLGTRIDPFPTQTAMTNNYSKILNAFIEAIEADYKFKDYDIV